MGGHRAPPPASTSEAQGWPTSCPRPSRARPHHQILLLPCPDDSLGQRPLRQASAELLGQSDDDALRATQEAEPVAVLVLRDLADEFGTVAAQAGNDVVDVVDSEHDAAYAQRVRRRA